MTEQPIPSEIIPEQPPANGIAGRVEGDYVEFGPGVAGAVSARQDLAFTRGASVAVAAGHDMAFSQGTMLVLAVGHDMTLDRGGGGLMTVGGSVSIDRGGAFLVNAGGAADIERGGAALVISPQVSAARSRVGVIIGGSVNLSEDSRVMFSTLQAAAFGAAFGAVFGVLAWLLRCRSSK